MLFDLIKNNNLAKEFSIYLEQSFITRQFLLFFFDLIRLQPLNSRFILKMNILRFLSPQFLIFETNLENFLSKMHSNASITFKLIRVTFNQFKILIGCMLSP